MENMVKIEFDVAWDEATETLADVLVELERECGAKATVVTKSGPGGGWPVVEFTVDEANLEDLMVRLGYDDDFEFYREWARPIEA